MKQRWSILKEACGESYRYYQHIGQPDYAGMARWIYKNIYRTSHPVVSSPDNLKNQQSWDEYTVNTVGRCRANGQEVNAQIQRDGSNQWVAHTDIRITPSSEDKLVSVVHYLSPAATRARFQITVKPAHCGQPLHRALLTLPLQRTPVAEFKVMNPQTGAQGPDSAVFYLSESLSSSGVNGLVSAIETTLRGMLEPLVPAPWGLQELGRGIYGLDVPTEEQQRKDLLLTTDFDSAGNIMSHLVAVAAGYTWMSNPSLPSYGQEMYDEVRKDLTTLCKRLGWALVE